MTTRTRFIKCAITVDNCSISGEVGEIMGRWKELALGPAPQVVLLSGILSFSLNVSSFIANKVTSALTLCVAANVKQVRVPCRFVSCRVDYTVLIIVLYCIDWPVSRTHCTRACTR